RRVHVQRPAVGAVVGPAAHRAVGDADRRAAVYRDADAASVDHLTARHAHVPAVADLHARGRLGAGLARVLQQQAGAGDVAAAAQHDAVGRAALVLGVVVDAVGPEDQVLGVLREQGVVVAAVDRVAADDHAAAGDQV